MLPSFTVFLGFRGELLISCSAVFSQQCLMFQLPALEDEPFVHYQTWAIDLPIFSLAQTYSPDFWQGGQQHRPLRERDFVLERALRSVASIRALPGGSDRDLAKLWREVGVLSRRPGKIPGMKEQIIEAKPGQPRPDNSPNGISHGFGSAPDSWKAAIITSAECV